MKLKDHPKFPSKHYWVRSGQRKQGKHDPIDLLDSDDMRQAVILNVQASHDLTGVEIEAKHSDTMGITVLSVENKKLASNLLQAAQTFIGKTFDKLREAEVTDEMSLNA